MRENASQGFTSILVIVLIVVTGAAFYLLGSMSTKPTAIPTPTATPVQSAQPSAPSPATQTSTYTNTQYGFSFRYMKDATLEENVQDTFTQVLINKSASTAITVKASTSYTASDSLYVLDNAATGQRVVNGTTWKEFVLKGSNAVAVQTEKDGVLYSIIFSGVSLSGVNSQLLESFTF